MQIFFLIGLLDGAIHRNNHFVLNQTEMIMLFFVVQIWFKHILLARTVDIIKQMLTILKLQGLEWKQHAYIIPFLNDLSCQDLLL